MATGFRLVRLSKNVWGNVAHINAVQTMSPLFGSGCIVKVYGKPGEIASHTFKDSETAHKYIDYLANPTGRTWNFDTDTTTKPQEKAAPTKPAPANPLEPKKWNLSNA
jgi:hypothetical protein